MDLSLRIALIPFLLITFYRTVQSGRYWLETFDATNLADWLINYQGGFVRRGLIGEALFQIHLWTQIDVGLLATSLQLTVYFTYFLLAGLILLRTRSIASYWLIIFSPFLFRFQLQGHGGGFRKEILFFALFAILTYASINFSHKVFRWIFWGILLVYPAVVLSHEMLILLLPYFIILYLIRIGFERQGFLWVSLGSSLSLLAFGLALTYKGEPSHAIAICHSIGIERVAGCTTPGASAIGWIGASVSDVAMGTKSNLENSGYMVRYSLSIVAAAIAYWPFRRSLKFLVTQWLPGLLFWSSIMGTGLLFSVAHDWDRFLYMHLVAIFFLALAAQNQADPPQKITRLLRQGLEKGMSQKLKVRNWSGVLGLAMLIFLYAKTWYIGSCCTGQPGALPLSPFGVDLMNVFQP
ncbi:MAG: hypothetical protein F6J87_22915 [Spirulina sp. SIO3F2]|nr:hypothetical protein [Spirulina sp. SIO3F2]